MASRKIEADVVVKVTGAEDVEAVAEQVRELADQTTSVSVEVDGEDQVARLREEFKDLDNVTVTATAKIANENNFETFLKNVRGLDGETATAVLSVRDAQAQQALREVVTTIADINSTTAEVDVATGKVPALTAEIEAVEAEITRLNATPVDVLTQPAEEGLRRVGDNAGQAGQVVSNAMGNASQDIAAMAGVTGTAGQAVGQMAEMFVEAASGAGGLAAGLQTIVAAAGPIIGIAAVIGIVTSVLGDQAAAADASAERTKAFGEAMASSGNDALGFADVLRDQEGALRDFAASANDNLGDFGIAVDRLAEKIPGIGGFFERESVDIIAAMGAAGLSVYDFSAALADSFSGMATFQSKLQAAKQAGQITGEQFNAVSEAVTEFNAEAQKAAQTQALFNVNQAEANALLQASRDPLTQYADAWATLQQDMADGTINTEQAAMALNELATKLGLTRAQVLDLAQTDLDAKLKASQDAAENLADGMSEVNDAFEGTEERVAALGRAFDAFNADSDLNFSEMAVNTVESFDSIKAALEDVQDVGSKPLVPTTVEDLRGLSDESAAVVGAIGGMRDAIQTELGAALAEAGGNFDGLRDKASFFRDEVTSQFTQAFTEMGLGPDEVEAKVTELLGSLGLLPSQVETVIKISEAEEATRKIELFGSALDSLPPEVVAQVAAAVDANDPVTAWNLINAGIQAQGGVPVDVVPGADTATPAIAEITGTEWTTSVAVGGENKEGLAAVGEVATTAEATKPIIDVNANTAAAIVTMLLINGIAKAMAPVVTIGANTFPAIGAAAAAMQLIGGMTATPSVNAVLRDYPTATEIANRIGVVRVPIDTYIRNEARVTGVRD